MNGSLVLSLVGLTLSGISLLGYYGEKREDHTCIEMRLKIAQATADLARTEGDIRAEDPDEECDLACAAMERHRNILMSEIRDYYKTLREHSCGAKEQE